MTAYLLFVFKKVYTPTSLFHPVFTGDNYANEGQLKTNHLNITNGSTSFHLGRYLFIV
uniref:Uncharacterized protein n=1 Tax=Anguilla anguilla TaxID=7936 RepID=A0A0E9SRA9_ANGAN